MCSYRNKSIRKKFKILANARQCRRSYTYSNNSQMLVVLYKDWCNGLALMIRYVYDVLCIIFVKAAVHKINLPILSWISSSVKIFLLFSAKTQIITEELMFSYPSAILVVSMHTALFEESIKIFECWQYCFEYDNKRNLSLIK